MSYLEFYNLIKENLPINVCEGLIIKQINDLTRILFLHYVKDVSFDDNRENNINTVKNKLWLWDSLYLIIKGKGCYCINPIKFLNYLYMQDKNDLRIISNVIDSLYLQRKQPVNKRVMKCQFGSRLFGFNNEESDYDFKGIFIPSNKEILLGKIPKTLQCKYGDIIDIEEFSIHYFINLCLHGQTNQIDMLHCPNDKLIYTSYIWDEIVKNREKFYSKNLIKFLGYAKGQMLKYNIKVEYLNEFIYIYNLIKDMFKGKIYILKADWALLPKAAYMDDPLYLIWDYLPQTKYCKKIKDDKGNMFYEINKKKFQSTVSIEYLYHYLENEINNKYGDRAKKALAGGGIDWKAVTHGFRTLFELKQIINENRLTFPLKEIEFLKEIRKGELNYEELFKYFNHELDKVNYLFDNSDLPDKPEYKFWENFLYDLIDTNIKNE